jgi:ribosomal protein L18E
MRNTVPPDNPTVAQLIKKFRAISRIAVFISTMAQRLSQARRQTQYNQL